MSNASTVFSNASERKNKQQQEEMNRLYQKIGQLQVEAGFLKKVRESRK